MVRLATPYPAHHGRCRLGSLPIAPGTIAGLYQGDGSWSITSKRNGRGVTHGVRLSLAMRDDDPTPFAAYEALRRWTGAPVGWLRHNREYRVNEWHVDAAREVADLCGFFTTHPVIAPRAWGQLNAAREAALILAEWSGGRKRPGRLPEAARLRLRELQDAIPDRAPATSPLPAAPTMALVSAAYLGDTLAGLVAAEGYLGLRTRRGKFSPVFALPQRIDNGALLTGLRDRLGIGTVTDRLAGRRGSPSVVWRVERIAECAELAGLLRRHPLPAASPKAAQLDLWTAALGVRDLVTGGGRRHGASASPDLAALYEALRAAKRYGGPRLLCECPQPAEAVA